MTRHKSLIINKLLQATPRGSVLTTSWLKKQGISNKLAWWYVTSGWFQRIAGGAYYLSGDTVTWESAIAAIQQQLKLPIHVGGKTALQLLGKGHYLNQTLHEIHLFSPPNTKLPKWSQASFWTEKLILYRPALFEQQISESLINKEFNGSNISLSTPERASLELCHLVPNAVTFSEAALIIEGLSRMRPKLMQQLSENCRSYKAKRLLLYLSEHFEHEWVSEINLTRVDLGNGKRVIADGGHYNAKYKISVPPLETSS